MASILIVDDNDPVRSLLRDILQMAGHTVREAQDSQEGLRQVQNTLPSLVIVDIFLPGIDGTYVIRTLHRDYPSIKIIAISGGVTLEDEKILEQAHELGAMATLHKPFQVQALLDTVHEVLTT